MSRTITENRLTDRRSFLKNSAKAIGALATGIFTTGATVASSHPGFHSSGLNRGRNSNPTRFLHACMTLPYRNFPLRRALAGIKNAGYEYVAWGTQHLEENGERRPVMPEDAHPDQAAELALRCRDLGLEPVKMFSTVYPDNENAMEILTNRIRQAEAAGIRQVLVFGPTDGGDPGLWVERFNELGPVAADHNVTLVLKQHGGRTTGTGVALARIIREVNHPNVLMSYDAGNIFWYEDVDPLIDISTCVDLIHGFCLKDGRRFPTKTTCGPGYGSIDHYRLFSNVAYMDRTIVLAYENIYPAYSGQPETPEQLDQWARHAREYMEHVIRALQES